jgi:TRAP-type C4-dicarboxylate transport system substrate-binding protein
MKMTPLIFPLAFIFGIAAGPAAAQPVMKIGTATINDVQHEYAKQFAALIEKQAPGKLKVEVYPAEQIGSNPRMIEGLSLGTVESLIGPPEFMVGVDPRYQILGAPGVVTDMDHAVRLGADARFRNALFSFGDARGIKGIGLVLYGPNAYATRKPVRSLADFKGLKMRTLASPMHVIAMEKVGATGVPMIPSEALQAISSGAIDGNRSGMTLFIAFKYFDVVKFATQLNGDATIYSMFAVGKAWFDKLPGDTQKLILDTSAALEPSLNKWSIEENLKAERTWKERGGEVIRITGPDQAEFEKRMQTVGDEVVAKNPRIKEAYELMVERARATRK